jgi:hypothetical protein
MLNTNSMNNVNSARTGKDGVILNAKGQILATVDSFTSNVTYTNVAYSVLGNAQELETPNTFKVVIVMSQVVIESDQMIEDLIEAMSKQTMPSWTFYGKLYHGDHAAGDYQLIKYAECIPSGQIDIQNLVVGDVIKRTWNFMANRPPALVTKIG